MSSQTQDAHSTQKSRFSRRSKCSRSRGRRDQTYFRQFCLISFLEFLVFDQKSVSFPGFYRPPQQSVAEWFLKEFDTFAWSIWWKFCRSLVIRETEERYSELLVFKKSRWNENERWDYERHGNVLYEENGNSPDNKMKPEHTQLSLATKFITEDAVSVQRLWVHNRVENTHLSSEICRNILHDQLCIVEIVDQLRSKEDAEICHTPPWPNEMCVDCLGQSNLRLRCPRNNSSCYLLRFYPEQRAV